MNKRFSSLLKYLFFLGLGVGLIWYSSKDLSPADMADLKNSFSQTRFLYILPVIAALLLSHFSRALRWRLLMNPLGYFPSVANTYLTVLIGYLFNLLVPRLGEVMKCTLLGKYEKIPADKLIGTIVAERAIDVVSLLLMVVIMVATQFTLVAGPTLESLKELIAKISVVKLGLYVLGLLAIVFLIKWLFGRFKETKAVKGIKKFGKGIILGLSSIRRIHNPGWFIIHSIFIWALYLGSIWLGFKAFPQVAHLGFNASVGILVFGSLGMIATQGGIGAYQFAVQKTLLLYGISSVAGLAFGWVLWGAQTAIILIFGLLSLLILPYINKKPIA